VGIGATAEGDGLGLSEDDVAGLVESQRQELERAEHYRAGRDLRDLAGRDVILVDDGPATGVTASAALQALPVHAPHTVVLADPARVPCTGERLREEVDDVICALVPADFTAVGYRYEDFEQPTDAELLEILNGASAVDAATRGGTP
jgi:putative phosphoribosyl transferase